MSAAYPSPDETPHGESDRFDKRLGQCPALRLDILERKFVNLLGGSSWLHRLEGLVPRLDQDGVVLLLCLTISYNPG
jgi:hypothetical protein